MFRRMFRLMDDDGSKALNYEEFSRGMQDAGLDLDASHLQELFDMFDKDKSGSVSLNEFLLQIRVSSTARSRRKGVPLMRLVVV